MRLLLTRFGVANNLTMRFGVGDENLSATIKHLEETLTRNEVKDYGN